MMNELILLAIICVAALVVGMHVLWSIIDVIADSITRYG